MMSSRVRYLVALVSISCALPFAVHAQNPTLPAKTCSDLFMEAATGCSPLCVASLQLCCRSNTTPSAVPSCYFVSNGARDTSTGIPTNPADATRVDIGTPGSADATKQATPIGDVLFKPQLTLPGSKFIAGQPIAVTGATVGEYIAALYAFIVGAIGILAALMVMYGGLKWLTAAGNLSKIQDAKDQIVSAVIGVMLALCSYVILLTISPKLVEFRSLEFKPIPTVELEFQGDIAADAKGAPKATVNVFLNVPTWLTSTKAKSITYDGTTKTLGEWVTQYATEFNVPEKLIYGIMAIESGGDPNIGSSDAGACGLMQLLPSTAGRTCQELGNGALSIRLGANYLKSLIANPCPSGTGVVRRKDGSRADCDPQRSACGSTSFQSDPMFVIAAYNGGQGANCHSIDCPGFTWWQCEANTGYAQTRNYVTAVKQVMSQIP